MLGLDEVYGVLDWAWCRPRNDTALRRVQALQRPLRGPGWCCSNTDGNGFFGDALFDPDVWVDGLTKMATMFAAVPNVVGMSLRNELRGARQNANDWYK